MNRLSLFVCNVVLIIILPLAAPYPADLEIQTKALKIINDFADNFCKSPPQQGTASDVELTGTAKADLNNVIKKVVDLGFTGAVKYKSTEYQGVLQKDLVNALKINAECRTRVFEGLKDKLIPDLPKSSQTDFFEAGWNTLHRFQLNKENPSPIEVGNCPGEHCYRFSLGAREAHEGTQVQVIFLEGGGFHKHLTRVSGGRGISLFSRALLQSAGGSYGVSLDGKKMFATLGLFKGAKLRLCAIDQDVLFVVEDDRVNFLKVAIALYDGTYCRLYREKKLPPGKKVPECEQ